MKSIRVAPAVCLVLLLCAPGIGAEQMLPAAAPPVSLDDLVTLALAHNRQIQSARLSLELARLNLRSTRASYFTASLNADGVRRREVQFDQSSGTDLFGGRLAVARKIFTGAELRFDAVSALDASASRLGDHTSQTYGFGFSQPLLRGFGSTVTNAPIVQGRNDVTTAADRLAQTLIDTIVQVESAYWNLVLQWENVKIQDAALDRSRRLKATTEALIAAGRVARNELVRTEADIAAHEVSLVASEETLRQAENQVRAVLDTDIAGPLVPIPPGTIAPLPADRAASIQLAFLNRPDWRSAQIERENSLLNVRVAQNNRLYALDVVGSVAGAGGARNFGSAFSRLGDQRSTTLGVTLDVPLNNTQNAVAASSAQISQQLVEIQIAEQHQQIELEVDDAVRGVNLIIQELELTRRARVLAEQALQVELEKLRVGRSTNFNVVQLQNDVNVALSNELRARIGYLLARSTLDRATGTVLQARNVPVR